MCVCTNLFFRNFDWNSSNYWNFFQDWNWNGNVSGNWNSFINRILNMIYIILLEILLYNWLSNHFLPGYINCLLSNNIVNLGGFCNRIQLYSLIFTSFNLKIYLFLLNYWKYKSIFHYFSSRSDNSFNFFIFSYFQFSL